MSNICTGKLVLLVHKQTIHGNCKIHLREFYRPVYLKSDKFQHTDLRNVESGGVWVALVMKT
jgi:hypothetical protein